jgi:cardiolipin synthase
MRLMTAWQLIGSALATLAGLLAALAAAHALLYKRIPQSAFGWIAICVMLPLAGALLYYLFGINRVERRAQALRGDESHRTPPAPLTAKAPPGLEPFDSMAERLSQRPLLGGNRVTALCNGEEAYPAMLEAIEGARERVFLSTYLFDSSRTGRAFVSALGAAAARGATVRVLVDGVGELYAYPRARTLLGRSRIRVGRFMPPRLLPPSLHVNLRNHRKILAVDGAIAFTGGMNIGERHLAKDESNPRRVIDMHFRFEGPVAGQIEAVFLDDWSFVTGEAIDVSAVVTKARGDTPCRAVEDGPDREPGTLRSLIAGAISLARRRVTIMTPYFLPTRELIGMMLAAALRGVEVTVILPAQNNLPYVHRATRHTLWELLERGIRVYYQPPPFVHTKLLLIDDSYALIGSANLDPRSLRLNFELDVEIYDAALVSELSLHCETGCRRSDEITLAGVDGRPLPTRLLDGAAWLFSPYL